VVPLLSSASLSGIDPQPIADSHPLTRDLDPVQINEVLALHAGFLLRTAASAGPTADPNLVGMMVALGRASLRWLRSARSASTPTLGHRHHRRPRPAAEGDTRNSGTLRPQRI
jgi:hypothetical protein